MKLLSFCRNDSPSYGVVLEGGVFDLGARFGDRVKDLKSLISSNSIEAIGALVPDNAKADHHFTDIDFAPVIPNPEKILCVGLNYEEHCLETGRQKAAHPAIFARYANSQMGHNVAAWRPRVSDVLDYEGELAVVIGKRGRYIREAVALDHVAGYSCYNDISVRDWQRHTHQFTPGKNFPHTGAFGPWLVTGDEMPNLEKQSVTTRLNGEIMQQASFDMMIFSVAEIIAYVSAFTTLEPGDVIATGTPGGVGFKRDPIVKMKPGDLVEIEITQVGTLRNLIENEPAT